MSKSKEISKTIKIVAKLFAFIIRRISIIIPYIFKTIYDTISKQLKFSITFKAATNYLFTFARLFFFISVLILVSFGGIQYFEIQSSLKDNAAITSDFLTKNMSNAKNEIKTIAQVQGLSINFIDQANKSYYAVGDDKSIPQGIDKLNTLTLINERAYLKSELPNNFTVKYVLISRSIMKEIFYFVILAIGLLFSFTFSIIIIVFRGSKTLKKMLKPIDDMIKTTRSISADDLHTRLNVVNSHDELKDLAVTFNEMLERIEKSYEKQNRFVSDASHELRTPIAVIQGYANLLQRWGKEDKEVLLESISAIKNEADNMKELVERLLFLARADKETQKVEKSFFPLNELLDEIVSETRLIDSEHQIIYEYGVVVNINADRSLIKQALRIFIDNSIKFTPKGGFIRISSLSEGSRIRVSIEDNGMGISAADLPYIFDRFYKCDESRTRVTGGTGLGLSIAKWIIEKHNGIINVESTLDKGTKIRIELPV